MALDARKNFAKATLGGGYNDTDIYIGVVSGQGALFPTPPFNAVWWNTSDYPDPSDDPNKEIVRVIAISGDTLTITRAQESTMATTKNTGGKTYKLEAGLTAKTMDDLGGLPAGMDFTSPLLSVDSGVLFQPSVSEGAAITVRRLPANGGGTTFTVSHDGQVQMTYILSGYSALNDGSHSHYIDANAFYLGSATAIKWGANTDANFNRASPDIVLSRVEAGVMGLAALEFEAVSSLGTPTSGNGRIGVISGEVNVVDSSGNVSVISPHAKDAPPELYETGPGVDEMLRRCNIYLGTVQWWATTRRQAIDALDMRARLGTPEDSAAAWTEVLDRRAHGRIECAATETCEAYEQRTGQSLYPGATPEERAAWAALTPLQRWDSVQQRDVAASVQRHADWTTRRDAALSAEPPKEFTEPEPALYAAQPAPKFIQDTEQ